MKTTKMLLSAFLLMLALLLPIEAMKAQCTYENNVVKGKETIHYNLKFNWKFIWLKAGTASMTTTPVVYKGQKAFRTSLVTRTSETIDRYFRMRDTIMVYFSKQLTPLYYRKGAHEGKRYYVDELWYTYPNGKCVTRQRHLKASGEVYTTQQVYEECVSDMLNSFQRVRNLDPKGWKKGHTIPLDIAGAEHIQPAKLVYRGKETVKADNGKKYSCLVLSYIEKEGGKEKEVVRFFVTNDQRHIPVRLDLFLKFGSAKAFLSKIES